MTSPAPIARNESRSSSLSSRLFRSKSGEALGDRKGSGSRLRKQKEQQQQQQDAPISPPRLPEYSPQPLGISPRMTSKEYPNGSSNAPPVPAIPAETERKVSMDPYARTESMTHRGRYSYAPSVVSSVNSPRRIRRRKDPTPFNVLVIGARHSGKTSLINFLKTSLALPPRKHQARMFDHDDTPPPSARNNNHNFTHSYQEIEVDGERVGLTLWDSQGLDKGVVDLQLRDISNFVESKFDDTFAEEVKVVRSHQVQDTHIHCVLLILDPSRLNQNMQADAEARTNNTKAANRITRLPTIVGALDADFDIQVLRTLQAKTVVVPVISKADTVTTSHMAFLKKKVWESLKKSGLDPLEALNVEEDEDKIEEEDEYEERNSDSDSLPASPATAHTEDSDTVPAATSNMKRPIAHKREPSNLSISNSMMDSGYLPMSILSPDEYSLDPRSGPPGRHFPWGFADPFDPGHCDFVKLKEAVFTEWRSELREASRERFYEAWRTLRLNRQGTQPQQQQQSRKTSGGIPIHLNPRKR